MPDRTRPERSPLTEPDRKPDPLRDPELPEPQNDPARDPSRGPDSERGPEPGPQPGPSPHPEPGPQPGPKPAPGPTASRFSLPRPSPKQLTYGIVALILLSLVGWMNCGIQGCPDIRILVAYQYGGGPLILDREGKPLTHLNPLARRTVALSTLPSYLPEAFIAVEDKRFRDHSGVDWRRVPGAVMANIRSRGIEQGFSTITMQLARNVFPERLPASQRTLSRKLAEIRVAEEIEDRFTKDEILELYLNHIYFGEGAYGVETAAHHYFGKAASELTLSQAATLAAIPRAPSYYDPRRQPERALDRRDLVLTLMEQQGRIDAKQASEARDRKLSVLAKPPRDREGDGLAPYFLAEIQDALEDRFGSELYYGGFRVETTIDRKLQTALEEELESQLRAVERGQFGRFRHPTYEPGKYAGPETPYLQGAAIVLDSHNGDVLALVGGRDHRQSTFDRALHGRRQVGSAFKPFVYATAIRDGWTSVDRLEDEPFRIVQAGSPAYEPHNFDGSFSGSVTVRDALVRSLNVPTVRLATQVGLGQIADFAKAVGFRGEIDATPAMALGTASASPLELALAYVPFATLGTQVDGIRMIVRVIDKDGDEILSNETHNQSVLDPALAYVVDDLLMDVVDRGTGSGVRRAGYRGVAAGKTGTTSDGKDAWFVGFTPDLVGVIWTGLDRPSSILAGAAGGQLVAPVWGRMMARAYANRPPPDWQMPPGVIRLLTDPVSGMVLTEGCWIPGARTEVFLSTRIPRAGCPAPPPPSSIFDRTFGWLGGLFGKKKRPESARYYQPGYGLVDPSRGEGNRGRARDR